MAPEKPRRRPLRDRLSRDEKQRLVNTFWTTSRPWLQVFAQDPHRPLKPIEISIPGGRSVLVSLTPAEIITLCPPDLSVAHLIDLDDPPFPLLWVCWWHGKLIQVDTPEALAEAKKLRGYGPTPEGPWRPADFPDPLAWPWQQGKGVFAPFPQGPGDDFPPWSPQIITVYATRGLTYPEGEWGRAPGELFQLRGRAEDHQLLVTGDIVKCEQYPQDAARVLSTNKWFIHEDRRDLYVQCYEQGDVRGLGFDLPAPARETPGLPCAPQPTPKATRKYYPDDEVLKGEYLQVYAKQTALQGSSVSLATVGRNMMPPLKSRTLRRYLKNLGIHHPPQSQRRSRPLAATCGQIF